MRDTVEKEPGAGEGGGVMPSPSYTELLLFFGPPEQYAES